jgi:DNA-binding GntR family transcriptional regulator
LQPFTGHDHVGAMVGLVRSTLAEQAYQELMHRIVSGECPAGYRLLPEELGQMLSVSPTPVKEALAMLARDRLIEAASRRGSLVRRFSAQDIGDIYEARLMIESRAIRVGLGTGRVDREFIRRLSECAALYTSQARRQTRDGLRQALQADQALHTLLGSLTRNQLIAEWHQKLLRQSQTVRVWTVEIYNFRAATQEHAAIIAAIEARDTEAAVSVLEPLRFGGAVHVSRETAYRIGTGRCSAWE